MPRAAARTAGTTDVEPVRRGHDDRHRRDDGVAGAPDRSGDRQGLELDLAVADRDARATYLGEHPAQLPGLDDGLGREPREPLGAGPSAWSSGGEWASSTCPTAVACNGSRPPTRLTTLTAPRAESRSM